MTRDFDLGDVLSITTGLMLSDRGMEGVHGIVGYMTGEMMTDLGCMVESPRCAAELVRQHPALGHPFVTNKLANFEEALGHSPDDAENIADAFVAALKGFVGPTLPVATFAEASQPQPIKFREFL